MLIEVVAPPPKLMVSATVFKRSNDVLAVVNDVVTLGLTIVGVLLNTSTPEPVSSVIDDASADEVADVTILLDPSRKSALSGVKEERVMVASLRTVAPDPLASSVRSPLAPVTIVNAPESAMYRGTSAGTPR